MGFWGSVRWGEMRTRTGVGLEPRGSDVIWRAPWWSRSRRTLREGSDSWDSWSPTHSAKRCGMDGAHSFWGTVEEEKVGPSTRFARSGSQSLSFSAWTWRAAFVAERSKGNWK